MPSRLREALIENTMAEQLVGHVSRDATAIEGREKATPKPKQPAKPKRKRGRPRRGEERPKEPTRLQRQQQMTLPEMLDDLPQVCDVGTKRNAKGYRESWIGYKLHIDAADGGIPLSCILTSASVHLFSPIYGIAPGRTYPIPRGRDCSKSGTLTWRATICYANRRFRSSNTCLIREQSTATKRRLGRRSFLESVFRMTCQVQTL
ncbi:MAG: hypothetical protein OXH96_04795 [Spirochaetaceae bacterium]|nr:hypothetical protein [Spirochaetaceae bacterium]